MQASLSLLLRWMPLVLMLSSVVARDLSTGSSSGRSLLLASCPASCQKCISQGTGGGKKCKTCYNGLVVLRSSDTTVDGSCGCPAGTYVTGSGASADCVPCTKGRWCPGGTIAASTETACPSNMVTLAAGAKRVSACVNKPGYKFVPGTSNAAPSATLCPANTYSPGLKQQQQCRACPSGFVTNPADDNAVRTTIASCYAPPGYYVNAAGVAVACPKGEWKSGYNTAAACTRCPTGVTTTGPAKTSAADCNTLRPGFQGVLANVTAGIASTSLCPRNSFCIGQTLSTESATAQGATTCSSGLWTQSQGAIAASQCQVPPGHFVGTNGLEACPDGFYREGWVLPDTNPVCSSCGASVASDADQVPIAFYAADGSLTETIAARTSAESCYIEAGYGLYKRADGSFVAKACNGGSEYGASARQYGLVAAPCKQCPLNMVVGAMASNANAGAFDPDSSLPIGPDACVTQAGYGYDTRTSQLCEKGTYAGGLTRDPCTPCPVGKTTDGEGKALDTDCIGEAGLGADGMPCPIGSYSTGGGSPNCTTCNPGLSTSAEGSTSAADCNVCAAGFSPVVAGTCSQCAAGLYSSGGMPASDALACSTCPTTTFALQGSDMSDADVFLTLAGVTTAGAHSASDCVASLAQLMPQLGPINVAAGALTAKADATTAADCAAACTADAACQFVNIQYNADGSIDCKVKLSATEGPTTGGWTLFGLKQVPAGDVGALSKPAAKSVGNGLFTWWADPAILDEATGLTGVTAQAGLTTSAACQDACTMSNACAGVVLVYTTGTPEPACNHVIPPAAAAGSADSNKRTLLKAVPTRTDSEALIQAAG